MHAKAAGNVIVATHELIDKYGPELLRLHASTGTHYRSPIEFSDDVLAASKKGLATFTRLFEPHRTPRPGPTPRGGKTPDIDEAAMGLLDSQADSFVRTMLGLKMKFLEMMDDDFNTGGRHRRPARDGRTDQLLHR